MESQTPPSSPSANMENGNDHNHPLLPQNNLKFVVMRLCGITGVSTDGKDICSKKFVNSVLESVEQLCLHTRTAEQRSVGSRTEGVENHAAPLAPLPCHENKHANSTTPSTMPSMLPNESRQLEDLGQPSEIHTTVEVSVAVEDNLFNELIQPQQPSPPRKNSPQKRKSRQSIESKKRKIDTREAGKKTIKTKKAKQPPLKNRNHGWRGDGFGCICSHKFICKKELDRHILYYTSEWKFKCDICQQYFYYFHQLRNHLKKKHKLQDPLDEYDTGCSCCGIMFHTRAELFAHQEGGHVIPEAQETAPVASSMSSPGETPGETPGQLGGETPLRPGWETPGRPGWQTPSCSGWETPGRLGWETPGRPGWENPGGPDGTTPLRSGGQTPLRSGGQTPLRSGGQTPFRPGGSTPRWSGGVVPVWTGRSPFRSKNSPIWSKLHHKKYLRRRFEQHQRLGCGPLDPPDSNQGSSQNAVKNSGRDKAEEQQVDTSVQAINSNGMLNGKESESTSEEASVGLNRRNGHADCGECYGCVMCSQAFTQLEHLRSHVDGQHQENKNDKRVRCGLCENLMVFGNCKSFHEHRNRHHPVSNEVCGQESQFLEKEKQNENLTSSNVNVKDKENDKGVKKFFSIYRFPCSKDNTLKYLCITCCSEPFPAEVKGLIKHRICKHEDAIRVVCNTCKEAFPKCKSFYEHSCTKNPEDAPKAMLFQQKIKEKAKLASVNGDRETQKNESVIKKFKIPKIPKRSEKLDSFETFLSPLQLADPPTVSN